MWFQVWVVGVISGVGAVPLGKSICQYFTKRQLGNPEAVHLGELSICLHFHFCISICIVAILPFLVIMVQNGCI